MAEYRAGLDLLIEGGIMEMHQTGTDVGILQPADSLLGRRYPTLGSSQCSSAFGLALDHPSRPARPGRVPGLVTAAAPHGVRRTRTGLTTAP